MTAQHAPAKAERPVPRPLISWLVGSLVWLGHVLVGRGVGDVPHGGGDRAHA